MDKAKKMEAGKLQDGTNGWRRLKTSCFLVFCFDIRFQNGRLNVFGSLFCQLFGTTLGGVLLFRKPHKSI